ncbi:MAG: putative nucleotidyltransferase with HDIG domain [Rhodothermales bacterium]|jgi:putative nucleotidyltransferase with HDIG domain
MTTMSWFNRDVRKPRRVKTPTGRLGGVEAGETRIRKKALYVKAAIFLALVLLTLAAFVRSDSLDQVVQVGDVWRQDNLSAPFVFAIEKPAEVRESERIEVRESTPPVFHRDPDALIVAQIRRDTLTAQVARALAAGAAYKSNLLSGRLREAEADSLTFERIRQQTGVPITIRQWQLLSDSYNERIPGKSTTSRSPQTGPRLDIGLMLQVWSIASQLASAGIVDIPRDSIRAQQVDIRNRDTRRQNQVSAETVRDVQEAKQTASDNITLSYPNRPDTVAIAMSFFGYVVRPTLLLDATATRDAWRQAELAISPNAGGVQANEVIVRRGDIITPEIQRKIISLEKAVSERGGARLAWQTIAGQLMLVLAIYLWFFLYLYLLRRAIFDDNRMVLVIAILFALVVVFYGAALRIPGVDMYMVPVAIAAVLLTVIFDSRVAIFGVVVISLFGSVLQQMDLVYLISTLFAGTLGVFSVRDIRNRGQFFLSAGVVYLGYAIILTAAFLLESTSLDRFLSQLLFVGVNSILVLLAYGFLWVFERAFDLTTDVTLLELSDTNRPLLKELSLRASGTFNHTLQVANLAEAAASAIGANALLTRVGALYHDVGKMDKPEYFVENQRGGANPHDQLKPRMSALIIASHVKEGLAVAENYGLPAAVSKFIPMHHGTTRIEYFYRRAVDAATEETGGVMESDFRYPGPRPDSKETAILMLADSAEAASRAMDSPNHKKLKTLIDGLVDARIDDHQLDDTDLTFRDLTTIKATFLNLLVGQFHGRVKYPVDLDKKDVAPAKEAPDPVPIKNDGPGSGELQTVSRG